MAVSGRRLLRAGLVRQGIVARLAIDHPLQKSVRDETAVPVVLAFGLDGREPGRQRAARHDVLGPEGVRRRVEIDESARPDVECAYAQPGRASIETIKIDQTFQRALEIPGVVGARSIVPAG